MTRGRFVLITNEKIYVSIEFNGDMYFEKPGYGEEAMSVIRNVRTREDFEKIIRKFNKEHHDYDLDEDGLFASIINMNKNIINIYEYNQFRWTDYTFYKNASENEIILHCENGNIYLKPYCSVALCFGNPNPKGIPEQYRENYPEDLKAEKNTYTKYRYNDSKHIIIDTLELPGNGVLHQFKNPAGIPYSAIYVGEKEFLSCERAKENDMIRYWLEKYKILTKSDAAAQEKINDPDYGIGKFS